MTKTSENNDDGTERNYYATCYDCGAGLSGRTVANVGSDGHEIVIDFESGDELRIDPTGLSGVRLNGNSLNAEVL